MDKPQPPPEAVLLRRVRTAAGIRAEDAAAHVARHSLRSFSKSRWSQIENGYESRDGARKPISANAATLAHMARAVGISPERLEDEGRRPDAAEILREILRAEPPPEPAPDAPPGPDTASRLFPGDPLKAALWRLTDPETGRPFPEEERVALIEMADRFRAGSGRGERAG